MHGCSYGVVLSRFATLIGRLAHQLLKEDTIITDELTAM